MNKIISISAWGRSSPRFGYGAVKNSEIAKKIFPEWKVRVFVDHTLPQGYTDALSQMDNVELCYADDEQMFGAFWRFLSFFEEDSIVISRDSDSRLTTREKKYIDEWIECDKTFSIIRDHSRHYDWPMLAGMWGSKGSLSTEILNSMEEYCHQSFYTSDQIWLKEKVWPIVEKDCMIHGHLENESVKKSWLRLGNPYNFIGQGWDENDLPIYGYTESAQLSHEDLLPFKFEDIDV
jgi:hypothetical protein